MRGHIITDDITQNVSNFLTDDESRVILDEIPELEGSDYINASWIDVILTINTVLVCFNSLPLPAGVPASQGLYCSSR